MIQSAARTPLWDNLRFALIFLVVLGHLSEYYSGDSEYMRMIFFFIYTFHIPAFIFVSGLFCKKTVNEKRYDRIFSYFVLYILIKIISYVSSLIMYGKAGFSLLSEGGIPWYAFALFAFCLLTIFLKRFNPVYVLVASVVLACFAGYDSSLGDKLVLLRIINFFPFFFAGYLIKPDKAVVLLKKKAVVAAAAVIMAVLLILVCTKIESLYTLRPLLSGRNPYSTLGQPLAPFGGLLRLACYTVSSILVCCVIALAPQHETFLSDFGSRTVQTYALHIVFTRLFDHYLKNPLVSLVGNGSVIWAIDIIPVALIITLICSLKIFEKPFNLLLSPGKAKTE